MKLDRPNQRSQAVNAIITSLNQGRVVHLSGFAMEIYAALVPGGAVHTIILEDDLRYFYIDRGTELKVVK